MKYILEVSLSFANEIIVYALFLVSFVLNTQKEDFIMTAKKRTHYWGGEKEITKAPSELTKLWPFMIKRHNPCYGFF